MLDVCVNMIARDAEDTIRASLESILPYVKRVILTIDGRSKDKTEEIAWKLFDEYKNLEVSKFPIVSPQMDLVKMRNLQIDRVDEPWVWIIDADEVYPEEVIEQIKLENDCDVYAFRCWAVWDKDNVHRSTSERKIPRIFRMNPNRRWEGVFGKEQLQTKNDRIKVLDLRYVHLTHVKKNQWRSELKQERTVDGKKLRAIPLEIKHIVDKFYENNQK